MLKALFETYSRLPYFERERIFYKQFIETISDSISLERELKVTVESGHSYTVIPYEIKTDSLSNYNYLVGWSADFNTISDSPSTIASFRLSKIKDVQRLHQKFCISKAEQALIEEAISKKGVQFLISGSEESYIKLSPEGIKAYNNWFYLRPKYVRIENNDIYVFDATYAQIEFYFFKFGKDAEILFPPELREKFKQRYRQAFDTYQAT